jgi:signal transduction histidine kinase/DNA-binding response OmpR family regulator/HAMP domain-containing protein
MKLKYRLSLIVIAILVVAVAAISLILLNRASTMQMKTAMESQKRLAAEQARAIEMRYEGYLRVVNTLANAMADYDETEAGRQRAGFDQLLYAILESEEQIIGVYAVFKPQTIDAGWDAAFAGQPGNTETGQYAPWYSRRSGQIEHLTYNDVQTVMDSANGPTARKELIYDPVPQTVAGRDAYTVKLSAPIIHHRTGEVVGRVGVNVDTAETQPAVDATLATNSDVAGMVVYSHNGTIIASGVATQVGKLLRDAQSSLFGADVDAAQEAVLQGSEYRVRKYSQAIKTELEIIIYPFSIGSTGSSWALMLGTDTAIIMADVRAMTVFTVIIAVMAVILTALIIFFVAGNITKPIAGVALVLHDVAEGDLTKKINVTSRDEIGDLARYFNETLEKIKTMVLTMNEMSVSLLNLDMDKSGHALRRGMAIMARGVGADRVSVWMNTERDGALCFAHQLSGGAGTAGNADDPDVVIDEDENAPTVFSYAEYLPDWPERLGGGKPLNLSSGEFSPHEQKMFAGFDIRAIFVVPIIRQGTFWGSVTFDRCHDERKFSHHEERIMVVGAMLLANAIIRNRMMLDLAQAQEDAMAASRAKGDFLSSMSHEIRTPINAITGMTAIARAANNVERKDYCLSKIEDASTHLLGVINNILDMSKIEANKFELSRQIFNFERMLQKVAAVINFRVDQKQQNFIVRLDKDIPLMLAGDDQRLAQVITNLLSNAVKFTPEGGSIRVDTKFIEKKDKFCTIQVSVTDSGIGISREQQSRLFKSFSQAERDTSRKYGGTGLGLAISKQIVEMMNGRIWIESEPGKGSTFSFIVRMERAPAGEAYGVLKGENRSLRILAVDDDPETLRYFGVIAERFGFPCDLASGGEEALALIEKNGPYTFYFIDWRMPGINGVELSRKIKERGKEKNSIIIMFSAAELSVIEEEAKSSGVDKFLSKPFFPSTIMDCINDCIGAEYHRENNEAAEDDAGCFDGYRLLLVEDVPINQEIVMAFLEHTKIGIDCAEDGSAALAAYCAEPGKYDSILMDVQMPKMDGFEATGRIRAFEHEKALAPVPIVAMTANVFREDIEKCLAAGMDDHLGKPLGLQELMSKLRRYLPEGAGRAGRTGNS